MPPVGFEHTISAGERPQTDALDRAATGIVSTYVTKPNLSLQCLRRVYTIDNLLAIGFAHEPTGAVRCGVVTLLLLSFALLIVYTSYVTFRDLTKQVDQARRKALVLQAEIVQQTQHQIFVVCHIGTLWSTPAQPVNKILTALDNVLQYEKPLGKLQQSRPSLLEAEFFYRGQQFSS
jgi:hypothetical protein